MSELERCRPHLFHVQELCDEQSENEVLGGQIEAGRVTYGFWWGGGGELLSHQLTPKCSRVNTLVFSTDINEYSVFIADTKHYAPLLSSLTDGRGLDVYFGEYIQQMERLAVYSAGDRGEEREEAVPSGITVPPLLMAHSVEPRRLVSYLFIVWSVSQYLVNSRSFYFCRPYVISIQQAVNLKQNKPPIFEIFKLHQGYLKKIISSVLAICCYNYKLYWRLN